MAEEKLGVEEVFDSFISNVKESISEDKAKAQEAVAEKLRAQKEK